MFKTFGKHKAKSLKFEVRLSRRIPPSSFNRERFYDPFEILSGYRKVEVGEREKSFLFPV